VEASRLLGVSRQFFVNLLERKEIPHHMVGTHRRVYLKDLMMFKCSRDRARRAVLSQMVQSELEAGAYDVVPDVSLVNDFSVLLDACAVVPISLCDLLLRIAEDPAMYKPKWSREIWMKSPGHFREPVLLPPEKVAYRIACMESAFPEAMISGHQPITDSMPNDPKDRHVLAAAVYGKVDAIVTLNSRHFPLHLIQQYGIDRLTPDEFLVHQWSLDSSLVRCRVVKQVVECRKDMATHIALLERMVPKFAALLRLAGDTESDSKNS